MAGLLRTDFSIRGFERLITPCKWTAWAYCDAGPTMGLTRTFDWYQLREPTPGRYIKQVQFQWIRGVAESPLPGTTTLHLSRCSGAARR